MGDNQLNQGGTLSNSSGLFSGNKKYYWIVGALLLIIILFFVFSGDKETAEVIDDVTQTADEESKEQVDETVEEVVKSSGKIFGPVTDPTNDCYDEKFDSEGHQLFGVEPEKCGPSVDIVSFEATQSGDEVTAVLKLSEEIPKKYTSNRDNRLASQERFNYYKDIGGEIYSLAINLDLNGDGVENSVWSIELFPIGSIACVIYFENLEEFKKARYDSETCDNNEGEINYVIDGKIITITTKISKRYPTVHSLRALFRFFLIDLDQEGVDATDWAVEGGVKKFDLASSIYLLD